MKEKVVILDFGHGSVSPSGVYVTDGKRSRVWSDGKQYLEGQGNREIGKLAAQMLIPKGWKVLYTVLPEDYRDVSLSKRVSISNNHYAKNRSAFQISIHSNGFSNPSANGSEVWTWKGRSKADPMADIWLLEMKKQFPWITLRTDKSDGDLDKESHFKINSVNCPSFLIESMFHTNEKECRVLMSPEGKYKIAKSIVNACERIHKEL
jgi:N-acetylmuramoyl-L-alanine amidase